MDIMNIPSALTTKAYMNCLSLVLGVAVGMNSLECETAPKTSSMNEIGQAAMLSEEMEITLSHRILAAQRRAENRHELERVMSDQFQFRDDLYLALLNRRQMQQQTA